LSPVFFEIRYAARKFARTPGLTVALLVSVALGIGSNVSVYGFIRGFTQAGYPLPASGGLVSVFQQDANRAAGPFSRSEYLSLQNQVDAFEWIGAARVSANSITTSSHPAIVSVAAVTANLAGALNLSLEKGVVISHRLWQTEFESKADIRGERIHMNGVAVRVIDIAPDWLEGLYRERAIDLWTGLPDSGLEAAESSRNYWVFARLRHGISASQARTAFQPSHGLSGGISVLPYTGMMPEMAAGFARIGKLLGIAASGVFLIACANVLSFLLGRAFARSRETALRVALGASRGALARGLLWDSVVISISGGVFGLLLALWTARIIPALLFEQDAESLVFAPDLFSTVTASITLACITIACGLIPVFLTSDARPAAVLQQENTGPSKAMARLRTALTVAQMASCCLLVLCAAFLLHSFRAALQTGAGQHPGNRTLATVQGPPFPDPRYFRQVEQAVRSRGGVSGIAWAGKLPGSQPAWASFRIEPANLPLRQTTLNVAWFTADSLHLFTLPPLAGRLFGFEDPPGRVVIVNKEAATELFDGDAAGRMIQDAAGLPVEIIGVVAEKPTQAGKKDSPTVYYDHTNQTGTMPGRVSLANFRSPLRAALVSAELDRNVVSPTYFEAMGFTLIAGQLFADRPTTGARRVSVVNQEAADLYFGGNPVGAGVIDDQGVRTAILGVVRSRVFGNFQRRAEPAIYFPMTQDCLARMTLIANIQKTNGAALHDLRGGIESVPGRGLAPVLIESFTAHLTHTALAPLRIASVVIGASAVTALLLSLVGLLGALDDAARRRRRELAIRMALGAQRWRIIWHLLREGGRLACAGTLLGMLGSWALSRLLAGIAPGDGSPDLAVWLAAPLVLAVSVLLASMLPARRALMVNPLSVLRNDS
jgi:ABC-type antimicrobial peptide transport system permease subunit